jgi:hypothetical protein
VAAGLEGGVGVVRNVGLYDVMGKGRAVMLQCQVAMAAVPGGDGCSARWRWLQCQVAVAAVPGGDGCSAR